MKIIEYVNDLRVELKKCRSLDQSIGLVPTMGFLHEGHLSLVKACKSENDVTVVSIFVNPTQFGPNEDLDSYPRDLNHDQELLEALGVDYIFLPRVEEMYPEGYGTSVAVESGLTERLCGASRPGHFKGVTTVVAKLFNIVQPDRAYFGQKDAQQVAVIKRMVADLNFNIEIHAVPIVRESDGLAMSSRNTYLKGKLRQDALVLSRALEEAKKMIILDKIEKVDMIINAMTDIVNSVETSKIDYLEVVDYENLQPVEVIDKKILIAMAVYIGSTRLIDNAVLEV